MDISGPFLVGWLRFFPVSSRPVYKYMRLALAVFGESSFAHTTSPLKNKNELGIASSIDQMFFIPLSFITFDKALCQADLNPPDF